MSALFEPFFANLYQCTACKKTALLINSIKTHQYHKCGPSDILEMRAWIAHRPGVYETPTRTWYEDDEFGSASDGACAGKARRMKVFPVKPSPPEPRFPIRVSRCVFRAVKRFFELDDAGTTPKDPKSFFWRRR